MNGKQKKPEKIEPAPLVRLRADVSRVRLSHILALKKLFRDAPGKSDVEIHFCEGARKVGMLQIGAPWGVEINRLPKEKLTEIGVELVP